MAHDAGARSLRPPCRSAKVILGNSPSAVTIVARCLRRHRHRFGFVVNRSFGNGHPAPFSGFSRTPRAYGPGAVSPHGTCEETRFGLSCGASADGWVTLVARVHVAPASRCTARFFITQVVPDSCQRKPSSTCPADLVVQEFFHGLPQGC